MAAKIAKEVSSIQKGMGEKIGMIVMSTASFFFGFAFAFYWGWLFTLIELAAMPAIMAVVGFMFAALAQGV